MVAIIGVLAAVAIPAYQRYQENAKVSTIRGSLNNIVKAYNACIAVDTVANCATPTINMTINSQPNTMITGIAGTGVPSGGCFTVIGSGSIVGYGGCVGLNTLGETLRVSADTDISNTSSTASCTAVMTVCAN